MKRPNLFAKIEKKNQFSGELSRISGFDSRKGMRGDK
jgi:hypothetical protein